MPAISSLFAWVMEESPGHEGIPSFFVDGAWWPMVGANRGHMESLRSHAEEIARLHNKPIRLVHAVELIELESYDPIDG